MDGLRLLRHAEEAGLAVQVEGDELIIRGPKRAEPLALLLIEHKPEVLAAFVSRNPSRHLAADHTETAAAWREQYTARTVHWILHGQRSWQDAQRVALGELILKWHRRYGGLPDLNLCAGCGETLPAESGLVLDTDGSRVHFDAVRRLDCLIAFGARWRGAAVAGLRALGIQSANEDEAP